MMEKFSDVVGVKLVGTQKGDGQIVAETDDRVVLTSKRVSYDADDFPGLFVDDGRLRIADLMTFLEAQAKEGRTHVEFTTTWRPTLVVSREEILSQQSFLDYVEKRDRAAKEAIVTSGVSDAERAAAFAEIDANTKHEVQHVEWGLSIKIV